MPLAKAALSVNMSSIRNRRGKKPCTAGQQYMALVTGQLHASEWLAAFRCAGGSLDPDGGSLPAAALALPGFLPHIFQRLEPCKGFLSDPVCMYMPS